MIVRTEHHGVVWVDCEEPTLDEVRQLMHEFSLDPRTAEELLTPNQYPRVEKFQHYTFVILHFPAQQQTHTGEHEQEVDFIIMEHTLITIRYDRIDALHNFAKVFEVQRMLDKREDAPAEPAGLFVAMLLKLYGAIRHELHYVQDKLKDIEHHIFAGLEREMVTELSRISRTLLTIRQTIAPHYETLKATRDLLMEEDDGAIAASMRSVLIEYHRLHSLSDACLETMKELRETNNSLLVTKQNEIVKTLTIMAFVTFPLTLIAGIFSMNTDETPLVGRPGDFWIITGVMFLGALVMFFYFKRRRWL